MPLIQHTHLRSALTIAALTALLPGCTVYETITKPPEAPPTAATSSGPGDDQQIRTVVAEMGKALGGLDLVAANALTCPRYQVSARTADRSIVPPINSWKGTEQALQYGSTGVLSGDVSRVFPTASGSENAALVKAITYRDHQGYTAIVLKVLRESTSVTSFTVDKIDVVSDTATGEVTATYRVGGGATQTQTKPNQFRHEDGKWTWCQEPPPGLLSQWFATGTQ